MLLHTVAYDDFSMTVNGNPLHAGDSHLGGEDFDEALLQHCVKEFTQQAKAQGKTVDITTDKKALARLKKECETAKRALSADTSTVIEVVILLS